MKLKLKEIRDRLSSNNIADKEFIVELGELIKDYYDRFYVPQFTAKETGVSRRDLNVWCKEGLLISRQEEDLGWKKYNMIECFWLNIVWKLKKFGVNNEQIIEYKNIFFESNASFLFQNLKDTINKFDSSMLSEDVLKIIDEPGNKELEMIEKELHNFSGSLPLYLIFSAIFHFNYSLIIQENGEVAIVDLSNPLNTIAEKNVSNFLKEISYQTFISINLQQIISNFFQNEQLKKDNDFFYGFLNCGEQKLISEIRKKNLKQVTVNIKDGSITHIRLTKNNKQNEQLIRQLSKLLKKGDYKKIVITTVDGNIAHYDEEEIIKM